MHLGILKVDSVRGEFVAAHGDYPDMFERLLLSADPNLKLSVFDVQTDGVPAPDCCDGFLITGSRDSVYDNLPWIPPLVEFIAELRRREIKLAGICFGHQLIAHFFGGKVGPAEQGWAVGVHGSEVVRQETWMSPALAELRLLSSHKDQVLELPDDATLFASNEFCPLAGFTVGDHTMTIQGHPEFNHQYAGELMTFRRELLGDACYDAGVASLSEPTDHQIMGQWLVNFFRATET